jgi:ABC-type multidrug transport system ATPase subunit
VNQEAKVGLLNMKGEPNKRAARAARQLLVHPQSAGESTWDGPILRIEELCRSFGAREVVRSLDLSIAPGERVALCGPNGSGKTTILRCIAGTLIPTSGRIQVGTHEAGTLQARQLIGVSLSQERSFYLRLSGRENLLFFARIRGYGAEAARRVASLGQELELERILAQRVDRCSTGMIQQLAFARALIGDPALLLLDEPTRSLDRDAFGRLWAAVERRPETALLIATHNEEDVERCHHRIGLSLPENGRR